VEVEEEEVAVAQDVADLVAIPVATLLDLVATLVVTLVATLVATLVVTHQEVEEVPQLLLSSQALMEEAPMGGLHMEGLLMEEALRMEGGPMVHTLLGPLVLSVADTQSSTRICLACLALLLVSSFETLGKFNTRTNKGTLIIIRPPEGCVWIIANPFRKPVATKM